MPTSEEVLAPPTPPSRPVLRAVVTLVLLGLVAWAVVAKVSGADPEPPAAAPPPPAPASSSSTSSSSAETLTIEVGPPLWVRYPNPLEGRWRSVGPAGRLTLAIDNARLVLTDAATDRSVRSIRVAGHRVHVTPLGDDAELATYRWHIAGDRLTFRLLERTPDAALRLESLTFHRRA